MTKEQEEAIKTIDKMIKSYIEADECGLSNNDFKHEIRAMQTVLSMLKETSAESAEIEKKNKEIEKLTIKNKDLLRKLRNRVRDVKKLQKYSLYKKEFSTLNKQIKEKDAEIEKLKTDFKIVDQECSRLERKEAKQDKMIDLIINTVYKRFKAELVLEYGFENEEQFKQCFERRAEDERYKV